MLLQELESSKIHVSNVGVVAKQPTEYLGRFIDTVLKNDLPLTIDGIIDSQNQNDNGELNIAYSVIKVEAQLPIELPNVGYANVGLMYNLKPKNPIFSAYSGLRVRACTNQVITNADMLLRVADDYKRCEQSAIEMLTTIETKMEQFKQFHNTLQTTLSIEHVHEILGFMLWNRQHYSKSVVTNALDYLSSAGSQYLIRDNVTTMWNVFNAMTQSITDSRDLFNAPRATLKLAENILKFKNNDKFSDN